MASTETNEKDEFGLENPNFCKKCGKINKLFKINSTEQYEELECENCGNCFKQVIEGKGVIEDLFPRNKEQLALY